jgi:hypothetical protein
LAIRSKVFVAAVDDEEVDHSVVIQIGGHEPGTVPPGARLGVLVSTLALLTPLAGVVLFVTVL